MTDIAIKVKDLSKQYRIGQAQPRYRTMRDTITDAMAAPFRRAANLLSGQAYGAAELKTIIWALKDVSFDVKRGEVIGVIGRNGAGKTTLLKILSRITEPTRGTADIYGRVGSLLEVGTGFHPELTGRENIFLNGAILGMKRVEIEQKFDEIVDFAEIAKFIDTPVKHYSSGMYVRLAFSVAAHLEPEILLVDEVLAVGDAGFQKKCLGKMGDVAESGRTVIFVSHNMAAILGLCTRCLLINEGQVTKTGSPTEVVEQYISSFSDTKFYQSPGEFNLTERVNPYNPGKLIIKKVRFQNNQGTPQDTFLMGQNLTIEVEVDGLSDFHNSMIGITFKSKEGQWLASINTGMNSKPVGQPRAKSETAILRIPHLPFTPGNYWIAISVTRGLINREDYVDNAASFSVVESDVYNTGYMVAAKYGLIYIDGQWEIKSKQK